MLISFVVRSPLTVHRQLIGRIETLWIGIAQSALRRAYGFFSVLYKTQVAIASEFPFLPESKSSKVS
jgi:hypothetical protein